MLLTIEIARELHIPTAGMEPFNIMRHHEAAIESGCFPELRTTRFYRDRGQLHQIAGEPIRYTCFVQRADGFIAVVPNSSHHVLYEIIKKYLEPDVSAEVIHCRVPVLAVDRYGMGHLCPRRGPLWFLALHHPSQVIRTDLSTALLMEMKRESA